MLEVGGNLAVELLDGFVPEADADFRIFDVGTLSGALPSVLLPDLPGVPDWDSSHLDRSGTLSVIPEPASLPLLALGMLLAWRRR
jgi:MYXO-CTERM domain-containing protein